MFGLKLLCCIWFNNGDVAPKKPVGVVAIQGLEGALPAREIWPPIGHQVKGRQQGGSLWRLLLSPPYWDLQTYLVPRFIAVHRVGPVIHLGCWDSHPSKVCTWAAPEQSMQHLSITRPNG